MLPSDMLMVPVFDTLANWFGACNGEFGIPVGIHGMHSRRRCEGRRLGM